MIYFKTKLTSCFAVTPKIETNVGSYTQGRIAGNLANADLRFLSSRKAARAGQLYGHKLKIRASQGPM